MSGGGGEPRTILKKACRIKVTSAGSHRAQGLAHCKKSTRASRRLSLESEWMDWHQLEEGPADTRVGEGTEGVLA